MKASHIGALLLASTGLLACGGGGEEPESRATAMEAGEEAGGGILASAEEVLALKALYASAHNEETAGIASAAAGPMEGPDTHAPAGASVDGRAKALGYSPRDADIKWAVWQVPGDQFGPAVTAAGAVTNDAWSKSMLRFRVSSSGLGYSNFRNGDAAVASCEANKQQCLDGTIALLRKIDSLIKTELNRGTCQGGTAGGAVYEAYGTVGRKLMATDPSAVRFIAHSTLGIAMYTGINWVVDLVGPYDPTKISLGLKQYSIWLVGAYLSTFIGADLRVYSAKGLITIQNTAIRGKAVALIAAAAVAQQMEASCQDVNTWWGGTGNTATDGFDIELGTPAR